MKQLKRNIAIVCGGDSSEHDVSLRSAQGLYSFFDKERYNVYIVDIKGQDWHVELPGGITAKIDRNDFSFIEDGKAKLFDYAYITIHGTPGENGILQGYLDLVDIPYSTSGVLVEAMTFDKFVLNQYLRGYGVAVADSLLIRQGYEQLVSDDEIEQRIGMPCFVKPAADGSSFGVSKVKKRLCWRAMRLWLNSIWRVQRFPLVCIRPGRSQWCYQLQRWLPITSSSIMMPNTMDRSRRLLLPASLRMLPVVFVR